MKIRMQPPASGGAYQFIGADHGGAAVSFFDNHTPPGRGPGQHRHPYHEVFLVHDGHVEFAVDGETIEARGGEIVVVEPGAAHGFRNVGSEPLHMVSIHCAAEMTTEWIDG